MLRTRLYVLLVAMFSMTFAQQASADRSEGAATGRQGVVRCGGNNLLRLNGTEVHFISYTLRNFDSTNSIGIDRLRIFDANGNVLFDTANNPGGSLPPAENGVLGPTNNMLAPNQTAQFDSNNLIEFLAQPDRPIQFEVQWSASRPALSLDVVANRIVRGRNATTGNMLEERARSALGCRTIELRRGG
jgi:hypothetical protein